MNWFQKRFSIRNVEIEKFEARALGQDSFVPRDDEYGDETFVNESIRSKVFERQCEELFFF